MASGISTFFGLETTLRGLLAQQSALDVTSHNIANANTQGYSRQVVNFTTPDALQVTDGARLSTLASLGTGVDIQSYTRIRDQFLDLQYRAQNMVLGQQSATSSALSQVQSALAEPGDNGISAQLAKFWSAWSDVANNPSSTASRQALVDQANTLVSSLHSLDSQLTNASNQASAEYTSLTASPSGEIAQDALELSNLNAAIKKAVAAGDHPNDLLDKRDQLLDTLSGLGQVSVTDLGNGSIQVNFGDAANPIVDDTTVNWPQTLNNPGPPPTTSGGKLGALNDLFKPGGTIDSLRSDLNGIASDLATSVNAIHNTGGPTGVDFFSVGAAGTEAATIGVNVTAATVVTSTSGAAGDNDIANRIAALRGGSTDSLYSTFVTRIGSMVQTANRQQATAQALVNSVDSSRQSTSGVSMDEEMTNMVRFQRAYQASARAMTTMDQMLDTLINRTGSVGL
ncbi:MAG TPA: flagellar hook-associated protein FlgK [Thermoleophilaceae bacterium]|nr:flagellar hook-associated protein FlgK [Thermoleophilaceae bacterium]